MSVGDHSQETEVLRVTREVVEFFLKEPAARKGPVQ